MQDARIDRLNANQAFETLKPGIAAQEPKKSVDGFGFLDDCTTFPWQRQVRPELMKLITDTQQNLANARTEFGRTKVLDRFVSSLNQYTSVQTSYPAKPAYIYSVQDLKNLMQHLTVQRHKAEVAGQTDKVKNLDAMLDAVDTALQQRTGIRDFVPPHPLPLFPQEEHPFIKE